MTSEKMDFEEAMNALEQVVQHLESGDVPLEKAIDLYKKGMELSAFCQKKLQHAEEQFLTIMDGDEEKPFNVERGGSEHEE